MIKQYRNGESIQPTASRPVNFLRASLPEWVRRIGNWQDGAWGWLPLLILVMGYSLLLISIAFRASVSGIANREWFYWVGLLLLVVPVVIRLASVSVTRQERLALVVLLGMALYGVKVIHSPAAFTYTDELVHYANANEVLGTYRLFGQNSILAITPSFPGLSTLTSAIASLSGLSIFASGLLVIGAARLIITLSLFLIFEKISNSARLAGLASVIYMANSNYLYWSAQYAYESLALPVAIFVAFVVFVLLVQRKPGGESHITSSVLVAIIGLLAVTVTHHLTSFALTGLLAVAALFYTLISKENWKAILGIWLLAFVSLGAVMFWNLWATSGTFDYLYPVIMRMINAGASLVPGAGGDRLRMLFVSNTSGEAPAWEQVIGLTSMVIILVAIPIGLWGFWRYLRWSALGWVLVLATLAYLPLQVFRFTDSGWEIANRTSEFLFVGAAFIISLAFLSIRIWRSWLPVSVVAGIAIGILFIGGVISGWPPALRMAQPYRVVADNRSAGDREIIEPPGVAAARWALNYLGPGNRMAADSSNARLMQAYGGQYALSGEKFGIRDLFVNKTIGRGELEIIQVTGVEYLVFAHPFTQWEDLKGLHYIPAEVLAENPNGLAQAYPDKFDRNPRVDRLLDLGLVVIYKIGGLTNATIAP